MATNTQLNRVGFDAAAAERSRRNRRHTRRRDGSYPRGVLRFATGIVLIVALVAAGFGAASYSRAARSENRVANLQAEVAVLQQRVAGDERAAAGEQRHAGSVVARANAAQRSIRRFGWQLQSLPSQAELAGLRDQRGRVRGMPPAASERDQRSPAELENLRRQAIRGLFQAVHVCTGVGLVLDRADRPLTIRRRRFGASGSQAPRTAGTARYAGSGTPAGRSAH